MSYLFVLAYIASILISVIMQIHEQSKLLSRLSSEIKASDLYSICPKICVFHLSKYGYI